MGNCLLFFHGGNMENVKKNSCKTRQTEETYYSREKN